MASGSPVVSTSAGSSPIASIMAVKGSDSDAAHRLRSSGAIHGRLSRDERKKYPASRHVRGGHHNTGKEGGRHVGMVLLVLLVLRWPV